MSSLDPPWHEVQMTVKGSCLAGRQLSASSLRLVSSFGVEVYLSIPEIDGYVTRNSTH